jgi:hypothetical protein
MFFVRRLSSNGNEVFVNPDQVLYVRPVGLLRHKTALMMTHSTRLVVDQDSETVRLRFEEYLQDFVGTNAHDDPPSVGERDRCCLT